MTTFEQTLLREIATLPESHQACLKSKNKPVVNLRDSRSEAFARNEIGRALSQMLDELPKGTNVALERLSVQDMRFKSK